jgi:dTDP-4-dehydrorhamnose reductase
VGRTGGRLMRVLILGGGGMLGHKLWQVCRDRFDTWVTVRGPRAAYRRFGIFDESRLVAGVDAGDFDSIVRAIGQTRPDAVVNCIGIVKQLAAARDPIQSIAVNSLFPHRAAALCAAAGARFVHLSTDCVYAGTKGHYTEQDVADATDLYGRSKLLGEPDAPSLTLRTSMIGRELSTSSGLVEWFLANRGKTVAGYTRAYFSGLTTEALSHTIADLIEGQPSISGVQHLAAEPISKYDLLVMLRDTLAVPIDIQPRDEPAIDRTLDGSRLAAAAHLRVPGWPEMIRALAEDPTPYADWRHSGVA